MAGLTQEQKNQFFDLFKSMTIMDAAEMKNRIKEELGIEPAAGGAIMMAGTGVADAPAAEEPTEFTVTLTEVGDKKIQVIKVVRELTGAGLKEAKEMVDGAPAVIKESVSKEEAAEIVSKIEASGAKAKVAPV